MSTLQDRIREVIAAGHPVRALAAAAGVSSSAVSQWKSGETKTIKAEPAMGIEAKTGYRAEWIVSGKLPKRAEALAADEIRLSLADDGPTLAQIVEGLAHALEHLDDPQRERAADKLRILAGAPDSARARAALVDSLQGRGRDSQMGGLGEFGT